MKQKIKAHLRAGCDWNSLMIITCLYYICQDFHMSRMAYGIGNIIFFLIESILSKGAGIYTLYNVQGLAGALRQRMGWRSVLGLQLGHFQTKGPCR